MSAHQGNTQSLKVLTGMKADLKQPDNKGNTPALHSAQKGEAERLKILAELEMKVVLTADHL